MSSVLTRFVARQLFEQKGAIANRKAVDFSVAKMAERLTNFGIDPRQIKTEKELVQLLNLVKQAEDQAFSKQFSNILGKSKIKKPAEVFDLQGKKIPDPEKNIMGGQAFETEEEIAERIAKQNKESIERLKEKRLKEKLEDADDLDPEEKADGGRIGFKKGMSRRTFLGLMGAGAAGIGAAKTGLLKLLGKGKATAKIAEVTTPSVAGKPSWFDALANRVISEGENVTKRFATKDREIVHVKALDDETTVYVYRDLDDGSVRIDIDDPFRNVQGDQGDALVSLEYKPGIADEGTKGKPPDTFQAVENDYANYMDGPDDYVTEVTDNTVTNTKDLTADLTKVKLYAKGQKKPTLKEFVESRKRKEALKQAEENPSQYAADRYTGPEPDTDYIDEKASGGLAGMLGE